MQSGPLSEFEKRGLSALKPTFSIIHEALLQTGIDDWTIDDVADSVGVMWHVNCEEHMRRGITQGHLKYCWFLLKEAIEFICKQLHIVLEAQWMLLITASRGYT